MSSTDQNPATASQPAAPMSNLAIEQLEDDLLVQKTIVDSLEDQDTSGNTVNLDELEEARAELLRIKKKLSAARRAHKNQASTASAARMNPFSNPDGVGHFSGISTPSTSMSTPSSGWDSSQLLQVRSAPASRKRSFGSSHLGDDVFGTHNKSRRSTPGSSNTALPTPDSSSLENPFHVPDGVAVIDLTGDDDEVYESLSQRQREAEDRIRHNRMIEQRDLAIARQLAEGGSWPSSPSPLPSGSQTSTSSLQPGKVNGFDRILGRPVQSGRHVPSSSQNASNLEFSAAASSGLPSGSRGQYQGSNGTSGSGFNKYKVPGAFSDSDSDDERFGPVQPGGNHHQLSQSWPNNSLPFTRPPGPARPSNLPPPTGYVATPSLNYMPNVPAAELARRSALARAQNPGALPHRMTQLPMHGMPYSMSQQRPGALHNGVYGGSGYPSSVYHYPGFTAASRSTDTLAQIINRTSEYDWTTMTDAQGNTLPEYLTNYVDDFLSDPRKTNEEIQQLLSNLRPDMDIPEEERGQTPEALRYPLYPHQQLALKWMTDMEEKSNKGGILADDMGLGKTLSTLALMVSRQSTDRLKANLIIGPVALIKQWEAEIKNKLKASHRLKVLLLYGKKIRFSEIKTYDVVLTTYGSIAAEWKRYEYRTELHKNNEQYDPMNDEELEKQCPLLHPKSKFYRIILDEAQCIKNKDTQSSKAANHLRATYRWCLTGTPMMNGVTELFPLIRFLKIKPYNDQKLFNNAFGGLSAKGKTTAQTKNSMKKLQVVLKAIMLRRMKNSEIDGKPILTLPEKLEVTDDVIFSEDESQFYADLESRSQVTFNKYLRQGTVGKHYSNILALLLRLRQACCHPHLNLDFDYVGSQDVSEEEMVALARTLKPDVVSRIKAIEAFECPICYDSVSNPTLVIPCGHDTCADCFASMTDNAEQNNLQAGQENNRNARCPQCRGPVDSKKIIDYTTFKQVHMPETIVAEDGSLPAIKGLEDDLEDDEDDGSDAASTDGSISDEDDDDDADIYGNLKGFIVRDDEISEGEDGEEAGPSDKKKKKRKSKGKGKGKKKAEEVKPHQLKTLRLEARKNREAHRRYMRYLRDNWEDSAKVTKLMETLSEIQKTGEKTIVFSQWTSLLDLVEVKIKYDLQLKYCRYDGSMSRSQRDGAVQDFVENPSTKVMLVSLRAGNAGLNLTAASHVIICDPFWNPYIEMQAVDRAHRIGQQRNVHVHRILVKETVEDRIIDLQESKRALINAALGEGEGNRLQRLSVQELSYLFGLSSRPPA